VIHELDRLRTGPIDLVSYALPAALALQGYTYAPIDVELDGRPVFGPAPALAFIGNVPEYGTGFPVLPHARSDDGVLDVCVLPCRSRADLVHILLSAITGEHVRGEGVIYTTATQVRITSKHEVPVQIDGEASGHTPLVIEMLESRVPFIVPERAV
jgi:diacylglycerol kinase (ATP)